MCPNALSPISPFSKPVTRTLIKRKRIYAFAVNRLMDAKTPSAHRFWNGVMDRCVSRVTTWEPRTLAEINAMIRGHQ